MLRDQFLNDGRFENTCDSCGNFGHDISDCPQVHFHINKQTFSKKIIYHQSQIRKNHNRKTEFKFKTFL